MIDRRRRRHERGIVFPLMALLLVTLLVFTAAVVDIGLASLRTRHLQQVADLVAVDVARTFDGRTTAELQNAIETQATETARANGFDVVRTGPNTFAAGNRTMTLMIQTRDGGTLHTSGPNERPEWVQVSVDDRFDYVIARVIGYSSRTLARSGTAERTPTAWISLGSVELGLQNKLAAGASGSIYANAYVQALNARLRAQFGGAFSAATPPNGAGLDIVSYRGLAAADVNLGRLATAAGFASPEELADSQITAGRFFDATATALEQGGNSAAANSVRAFRNRSDFDANSTMTLGTRFLNIQQGTGGANGPAAAADLNVLDLLLGAAQVVDGKNFTSFSLDPGIPGVTVVSISSHVVESPAYSFGKRETTRAETSQVRFQVNLQISGLNIPGVAGPINLPLVIEAAKSSAVLADTACTEPVDNSTTTVNVTTSAVRVRIGTAVNLSAPGALTVNAATLIQAGGITTAGQLFFGLPLGQLISGSSAVTGSADASIGGASSASAVFHPFIPPNPSQRVPGGSNVSVGTGLTNSFATNVPSVGTVNLSNSLSTVFSALGDALVDPLLHAAGITLGGADVSSYTLTCNSPQLIA